MQRARAAQFRRTQCRARVAAADDTLDANVANRSREGFECAPFLRASTLRLCKRYLFSMAMAASSSLMTRGFRSRGGSLKLTSLLGRFFRSCRRLMVSPSMTDSEMSVSKLPKVQKSATCKSTPLPLYDNRSRRVSSVARSCRGGAASSRQLVEHVLIKFRLPGTALDRSTGL